MQHPDTRENRIHSSSTKPFSYYECVIPDYFNCVPMHWHREFELNYIREGAAEFICGEEKFTSAKGDIILTQPNVLHSIYPCPGTRQVYDTLVFSPALLGGSDADRYNSACIQPLVTGSMRIPTRITSTHPYYNALQSMTEQIFSCARGDTPQLDMLLRSEMLHLFWLLETEAESPPHAGVSGENIRPALEYIAAHFREPITIAQLAASVHLSESYFMNQFRRQVGLSAVEYMTHFRIDMACKALKQTKCSVLEIALDCGFRNLSNFNRHFRSIAGCSPTEYRKKNGCAASMEAVQDECKNYCM